MRKLTITFDDHERRKQHVVMIDKIVRLSESSQGCTVVHLIDGSAVTVWGSIHATRAAIDGNRGC